MAGLFTGSTGMLFSIVWRQESEHADPLSEADRRRGGTGYHWSLWVGDTARGYYDDDASLRLDVGILAVPGVERVLWHDREEFAVGAPTLCVDGVTAIVASVLADPQVRV